MRTAALGLGLTIILAVGCGQKGPPASGDRADANAVRPVTLERLLKADTEPGNWMSHGRTYAEQRHSPLEGINDGNVSRLGLAWYVDLPTRRGIEATPLVVDGVMYTTGSWSIVYALDARTGRQLWTYDPQVPRAYGLKACCDVVNRGVAMWGDRLYLGTLDGRLIALDARTGKPQWQVDTRENPDSFYTITGAPRVVDGKVIIGNGGAEFGVRGYVTAYDAASGERLWRFYTVPGNPAEGFEDRTQAWIASTWTGEWWRYGGGGTAWDSFAYDPELDLLYIGVGNGSPWNQRVRSPGGGDNLFLSSIVAVKADTGEYVWHYQTTPGETWDYTATQHMILADITIDGEPRKVIMQAPKNGFFYVLDRATGELLSANNFVDINWATHVDMATGRPVETEGARYREPTLIKPDPGGAHSWHPMSYSPDTGLVYIPAQESAFLFAEERFSQRRKLTWHTGVSARGAELPEGLTPAERQALVESFRGFLIAWDPLRNREAWRVDVGRAWPGGVLSTAGNLVFQGNLNAEFVAYRANSGERLWSMPVHTGISAAPVSYTVDGEQYVTVMAGWGSMPALPLGAVTSYYDLRNVSRVLTFKLGGAAELPESDAAPKTLPEPPAQTASAAAIEQGHSLYNQYCVLCHGGGAVSGGVVADLRYASTTVHDNWEAIVIDGTYERMGMASFRAYLSPEEAEMIRAYVVAEAWKAYRERSPAAD